jgi:hypothetical protein
MMIAERKRRLMARPWRIQFENAVYPLAARGKGRSNIFLLDADPRRRRMAKADVRV